MPYDNNNVFARILRGELPSQRVYEDAHSIAFLDIMPQAEGHTLVLPKEGAELLVDLSPAALQATILTVQKLTRAVQRATAAPGMLVSQFNGAAAGQTVPHVHFHIIPRVPGQALKAHARITTEPAALAAMAEKIAAALAAEN